MGQKNKPVKEFRLGRIKVKIWANENSDHETWFNVEIVRLYMESDKWKESTRYGRDDLPVVAAAANMGYAWVWEQDGMASNDETEAHHD